jgi:hypothetical protein
MNDARSATTIDFDAVARQIVELTDLRLIREPLTLPWNACGAADIAKIETELATMVGPTASGPAIKTLERARRPLGNRVRC